MAKPASTVDAELTSDGPLHVHTAYSPSPTLTSISHPFPPGRERAFGDVGTLMDAGRKMDSSVLSTERF